MIRRRKGQEASLSTEVLPTIFAGVVAIVVCIWLATLILRITNDINTNQQIRDSIVYASSLIGNPEIAVDDGRIRRGLLDATDLDNLEIKKCSGLTFRYAEYTLIVKDRDNGKEWKICEGVDQRVQFPVAIMYPNGDIHRGTILVGAQKQNT